MTRVVNLTCAADIEPRAVHWLWPGYIPMGKVTVLAGAPGLGKSLLAIERAARVSKVADVLIASAEDDPADTIGPRLIAAEANRPRVHLLDVRELADDGYFSIPGIVQLPGDAAGIRERVNETGARLVILDPVAAFLDADHSAYSEQEVRAALAPLKLMAEDTGAAVLLVMHLNKADGSDPLRRIANSGAFTALARSVLLLGADPEDEDGDRGCKRILTVVKGNLRGAGRGSLVVKIETQPIRTAAGVIDAARLVHLGESNISAEDLLGTAEERTIKGEAMGWLRDLLAAGPIAAKDVEAAAVAEGYAKRTLMRAKATLRVRSVKDGVGGGWVWTLDGSENDPPTTGATLGILGSTAEGGVGILGDSVGNVAKDAKDATGDGEAVSLLADDVSVSADDPPNGSFDVAGDDPFADLADRFAGNGWEPA